MYDTNRQTPIVGDSYRPLLHLPNNIIRSGLVFINKFEQLEMDKYYENRLIGIYFYKDIDVQKVFAVGTIFKLAEGTTLIGEGVITECLGTDNDLVATFE